MASPELVPSPQPRALPQGYRFGPFVVDPLRRLLWKEGSIVALGGRTFDLLLFLLEHRDRLTEKEELLTAIWHGALVQENNLVRQMSNLRRALGQRPEQHDLIVTVSGRGYRFVGSVEEVTALPVELRQAPHAANVAHDGPTSTTLGSRAIAAPTPAPAMPHARAKSWSWQVLTIAALVGVLLILVVATRPWPVSDASPSLTQFTSAAGLQQQPTWAPDGLQLAYAADRAGNSDIWIQRTDDPSPRQLTTSPAADWQPDWSGDGRWVAFRSERDAGGLYLVPARGGVEQRLTTFGYRPRWSPDSTRLLFRESATSPSRSGFFVVGWNGDAPQPFRPDLTAGQRGVEANWHPDGRVSLLIRDGDLWTFSTAPLNGASVQPSKVSDVVARRLEGVVPGAFVWARSGKFLFFEGQVHDVSNIWRVGVDPATLAWTSAERVTVGASQEEGLSVTADGRQLAYTAVSERTRLWSFPVDPETGQLTGTGAPITSGGPGEFDAAVPVDGTRIAYRAVRAGQREVWEHSTETGRDRLLLTSSTGFFTSPRWSRDGTRLAYRRLTDAPGGDAIVGVLPVDSGREQLIKLRGGHSIVPDDWSPDGSLILGACRTPGNPRTGTCVIPASGPGEFADLTLLASDPQRDLICQRFSPDQRWISFMAVDRRIGKTSVLYVMPAAGGAWTPITDGMSYDDKPRWSADGRLLFFISDRGGLLNLWARRFDPATGRPVGQAFQVTNFSDLGKRIAPNLGRIEIAVSAKQVFLPISETSGKIWILSNLDR